MSEHFLAALAELKAKRDALNHVIATLEELIGAVPATPVVLLPNTGATAPRQKRSTPTRIPRPRPAARKAKPRPASVSVHSALLCYARDAAILKCLEQNDGIAKFSLLKAAMPKESDLDVAQADDAYRNTMTRLKNKKLIGRTGDTWSLVGIGSERA